MRGIAELAAALGKINSDGMARWDLPGPGRMATAAEAMAQMFRDSVAHSQSGVFEQRIAEAIRRFSDPGSDVDYRTLRLVCHGCSQSWRADGAALLADPELLRSLLGHVAGYGHEARRYRRLFDGLLRAYLLTDRNSEWFDSAAGREGTEQLRLFLEGSFANIEALEPTPEWVTALSDYPHILSPEPGRLFAQSWLAGDQRAFQDAAARLGLFGTSWLPAETLRSALDLAAAGDDRSFAEHMPAFLAAAAEQRFQPLRDDIYAGLLRRYAALRSPAVHAPLRDALVSAWKNPWLARNDSAWGRVPDTARKMVAGWLKLELIHQFFEVLSEDGRQDKRRFEFWRAYHEQIDDVYFALGGQAYHSRNADIVKLRSSLEGRLLELVGTTSSNNAFVMCLGDTVVVEFSTTGNAAYAYARKELRIDTAARRIHIRALRIDASERLIHRDTNAGNWEETFRKRLSAISARWEPTARSKEMRTTQQPQPLQPVPDIRMERNLTAKASDEEIRRFARLSNIALEDRRPMGGSLWLLCPGDDRAVAHRLMSWGFKFAPGKGWWRSA